MDVEALLAPLDTGEQGAGVDLRSDFSASSPYQRLRDARGAARAEERLRDADGDAESPDAAGWRDVLAVGEVALATQTKDLEIAAWMTEALVRRDGLQGLTEGARLIAGLCDGFWEAVFPLPDEDGLEARSTPIEGLSGGNADGTIMQPLRRLPLFRRADGSGVGLYQWEQAERVAALDEERRNARYATGTPELNTLAAEARLDRAFLVGRGHELVAAVEAWRVLDDSLARHFGDAAPSLRKVRELLDRMLQVVTQLGGVPGEAAAAPEPPANVGVAAGVAPAGAAAPGAGALTREGALLELDRIADFFRRTEPHSPLAYTLEEAVRRGRMSLTELLAEVLPDAEVRNGMLARLGMRPDQS
ncbi:MAG: type VI secretion system protein TssA [Burkholderiaceae bacterium]|nr:type VI secretion system protein TssA [Burkholderiaceae bacterium]